MGYIYEMYKAYQCKRAEVIAAEAHKGQKRKNTNEDYIEHPRRVVKRLKDNGIDNKLFHCVAWLHDVLEDTNITAKELRHKGISKDVVDAVELLTKKKNIDYKDYLSALKKNEMAWAVKIEDMLDNLSDRPSKRQILKYCDGLKLLLEENV